MVLYELSYIRAVRLDGRSIVVLVALLAGGCDARSCRAGTVYLTLDYAGASASADQLAFDVTVGDAHQHYVLGRTPGMRRDTLEVTFRQYAMGERLLVDTTAS